MRCNLACHYCHFKPHKNGFVGYGRDHNYGAELGWWEWLHWLDRFRPYTIEFTGGEPLMWKDFKNFIAHLPFDAKWAITSNTLLNISGIDLSKCSSWTSSYHYNDLSIFLENVRLISKSIKPRISLVAEKDDVERSLTMASYFAKEGYGVNILRQLNPDIDWRESAQWQRLKYESEKKCYNLVESDIPPNYEFPKGHTCLAGVDYFCAMPDGSIYRCYSHAMMGEPVGHVNDVILPHTMQDCNVSCLGCAKDFAARKIQNDKIVIKV